MSVMDELIPSMLKCELR